MRSILGKICARRACRRNVIIHFTSPREGDIYHTFLRLLLEQLDGTSMSGSTTVKGHILVLRILRAICGNAGLMMCERMGGSHRTLKNHFIVLTDTRSLNEWLEGIVNSMSSILGGLSIPLCVEADDHSSVRPVYIVSTTYTPQIAPPKETARVKHYQSFCPVCEKV